MARNYSPVPARGDLRRARVQSITSLAGGMAIIIGIGIATLYFLPARLAGRAATVTGEPGAAIILALVVAGMGLLALGGKRMLLVRAAALSLGLLGGLVLFDHHSPIFAGTAVPTGTSLNTAIFLLGIALVFVLASLPPSRVGEPVAIAITFLLLALGLAALGSHAIGDRPIYSLGPLTRNFPAVSLAFVAISGGLAAAFWLRAVAVDPRMPWWLPVLFCGFAFWFDLSTPLGVAAGVAYVPLVLFPLGSSRPALSFILAAIASLLIVAGYFLSPYSASPLWIVAINRALSIVAVWFTAVVVYLARRASIDREGSERQLRSVVNTVLDGLITIDAKGVIERFNPAAERIFGYASAEVVGRNVKMLMPEPYHGEHDGYLGQYLSTGERKIIGIGREVTARRKDGTVFPIELSVGEMTISGKRMFVGTIRDISGRKEAEREIGQYVAALQRSNQDLDDFAYIASHDLKEPLRGLSNNARFLQEDFEGVLGPLGDKRVARMLYLCQRMEQLVDDLLYFSRLGRQQQAVQDTDLNAVVADIEKMMETTLEEANARILLPTRLPTITADLPRITEAFRNLITNAVKYNDKPEKLVEIGCNGEGDERIFHVRDNGIGIPSEFHEEVFRIFKRLNAEDDKVRGSGVGLTFVRKIIERHNGQIWVESEPGKGSTFYFTLHAPLLH